MRCVRDNRVGSFADMLCWHAALTVGAASGGVRVPTCALVDVSGRRTAERADQGGKAEDAACRPYKYRKPSRERLGACAACEWDSVVAVDSASITLALLVG